MSLIGKLFGTGDNPPDVTKLDGTTEATLARSLSALQPDQRGWITFAEARSLFSTKSAQYAFGETDEDGRKISTRSRRSTGLSSTLCRSRSVSISYAIRPQLNVRFTPQDLPFDKAEFDVAVSNFGICHTHRLFDNRRTPCGFGSSCWATWPLR